MISTILAFVWSHRSWLIWVGVVLLVVVYGNLQYDAGKRAEELVWKNRLIEANARAHELERELSAETIRRAETSRLLTEARSRSVRVASERIANAPDFETRFDAYLDLSERLRDDSAEHQRRAWADYLSSLPSSRDDGPAHVEP